MGSIREGGELELEHANGGRVLELGPARAEEKEGKRMRKTLGRIRPWGTEGWAWVTLLVAGWHGSNEGASGGIERGDGQGRMKTLTCGPVNNDG